MPERNISVQFAKTAVGPEGSPWADTLRAAVAAHGEHLPPRSFEGERFQMRSLELVGTVWKGTFAKLRDDVPNYVHLDQEHELQLQEGAAVIEKCHFLYRETSNVLVWQVQRLAGGLAKAAHYCTLIAGAQVSFPQVMNANELEELLARNIYEVEFAYAKPPEVPAAVNRWSRRAFDIMGDVHAGYARFNLRANRGSFLADSSKELAREMAGHSRVKIRLDDDADPVKLFLAPLRERFTIAFTGRYPPAEQVFEGLEDAYSRQEDAIRRFAA